MTENFTPEELEEARKQLCFNICSHYDASFSRDNPEKAIVMMTIEADLPSWLIDQLDMAFRDN